MNKHALDEDLHPILLFDDECNFCNAWVRFVIKSEQKPLIRFAPLGSQLAVSLVPAPLREIDSIIFIDQDGSIYQEADAVIQIAQFLKRSYRWIYGIKLLPRSLRGLGYRIIAKVRRKIPVSKDVCAIPSMELRQRMLVDADTSEFAPENHDQLENLPRPKRYNMVIVVLSILVFLGSIIPGRGVLYPFVKFPMYGYSKDSSEMFKTISTFEILLEGGEVVPTKFTSYNFGYTNDVFSKEILRPSINGDQEALEVLVPLLQQRVNEVVVGIRATSTRVDLNHVPPRIVLVDVTDNKLEESK
ncbi:thiol-disulfide oxidoreductase DCC family protein [Rubritalea marina]|uniref:thiol-disulfide oxidoreductase DCC family protein n=1 Tax=Rubritalea marina TaxID=361055 RepID=UPI000369A53D|nr:DCC1-like thiol-disulfide oxidoreductase family protein [Rubritalea marina]